MDVGNTILAGSIKWQSIGNCSLHYSNTSHIWTHSVCKLFDRCKTRIIAPIYSACLWKPFIFPGPDGYLRPSSSSSLRLVIANVVSGFEWLV
jgi:hypothetical protein